MCLGMLVPTGIAGSETKAFMLFEAELVHEPGMREGFRAGLCRPPRSHVQGQNITTCPYIGMAVSASEDPLRSFAGEHTYPRR